MLKPDRLLLAKQIRERTTLSVFIGETVELKRNGREYKGLCPFHSEKTASFTVNDESGFYHCFGCGAHGDIVNYAKQRLGLTFFEAVTYLAQRSGLQETPAGAIRPQPLPAAARPAPVGDNPITQEWIEKIWRSSIWATPTVDAYLYGRGIDIKRLGGAPKSLRFARLHHSDAGQVLPCMVGAIQAVDRSIIGIHRTYFNILPADQRPVVRSMTEKLMGRPVENVVIKTRCGDAKKMAGKHVGGAVRLCPVAPVLAIAEGIETALSVRMATGMACWAALSLGNLATIQLPDEVREVVICADNDMKDERVAAALLRKAEIAHLASGRKVRVAKPPKGYDFNDLLWEGKNV